MRIKTKIPALLLALLFASSPAAAAEDEGKNTYVVIKNDVFQHATRTVQVLTQQALRDEGYLVQDPEELQEINPSNASIKALAEAQGVPLFLAIEALPLQSKYILNFSMTSTDTLQILDSRQINMGHLDEAETVIKRAIRSLARKTTIDESADYKTITKDEARQYKKRKGEFLIGISLSGALGLDANAHGYYGGFGRFAFETDQMRLDVDFGGVGGPRGGLHNIAIGGAYLFYGEENISPYIGMDMGWGELTTDEDDNSEKSFMEGEGIFFGFKGGLEFMRFYEVRLLTEIRVLVPAFKPELITSTPDDTGIEVETSETRYQPMALMSVTLLW